MRLKRLAGEKPGILVITPWLAGGGIERNIEIVAPWFARKGHRIKVLSWDIQEEISGAANPVLETLKRTGILVQRLRAFGALRLIQRAAQVAAIALRGRFSIVVGYEPREILLRSWRSCCWQAARGAAMASWWADSIHQQDANGRFVVVGLEHWGFYDQANENTNFGLVTTDHDNAYDGSADITNGEAANYGDAITPIKKFLSAGICDPH